MSEKVVVGLAVPTSAEIDSGIRAVSPRVVLRPLAPLIAEEQTFPEAKARLDEALKDVEIIFAGGLPQRLAERAPSLNWVQYLGTGSERLFDAGMVGGRFLVTNVTETNALPIAEHCILFMLMFMKFIPQEMERRKKRIFDRDAARPDFLEGKTVGILGLGGIGLELARVCKAFQMTVLGTSRSSKRASAVGNVDEIYPRDQMGEVLSQSDFVVVALPLTKETKRLVGERELATMKRTAILINVGRGEIIDEEALVRALDDGVIAGAGLDVFEVEPLPKDSPLWTMQNVVITPHVAGAVIDNRERAARFFCDNLRRYIAGEPLRNVLTQEKGY